MRIVAQRVSQASVSIAGQVTAKISNGILLLVGIEHEDDKSDADWLVRKITQLRIFNDADGIMNRSVMDTGGDLLVVSQFTLHGSTRKGNRPSYIRAAKHEHTVPLYEYFIDQIRALSSLKVETGTFAADMQVALINDGPVTLIIDSKSRE
ncbi:MAG: D-tyrosyl-tRNA(Tyr) deacylase [Saprospiraceae bacterium]|nr:D-tyrosyl-tRNA(Tyr) deacylase [Saprospiraceae bacterium]MCB9321659.1 D-tyrosyl-tRNA(Tyr) deacylase [Lewinellaceae bacterium]